MMVTKLTPLSASRRSVVITCSAVVESSPAVASSTKSTLGLPTSSIAMLTRRRSPKETPRCAWSPMRVWRTCSSPSKPSTRSTSVARASAERLDGSLSRTAKRSVSSTVSSRIMMSSSGT